MEVISDSSWESEIKLKYWRLRRRKILRSCPLTFDMKIHTIGISLIGLIEDKTYLYFYQVCRNNQVTLPINYWTSISKITSKKFLTTKLMSLV